MDFKVAAMIPKRQNSVRRPVTSVSQTESIIFFIKVKLIPCFSCYFFFLEVKPLCVGVFLFFAFLLFCFLLFLLCTRMSWTKLWKKAMPRCLKAQISMNFALSGRLNRKQYCFSILFGTLLCSLPELLYLDSAASQKQWQTLYLIYYVLLQQQ